MSPRRPAAWARSRRGGVMVELGFVVLLVGFSVAVAQVFVPARSERSL